MKPLRGDFGTARVGVLMLEALYPAINRPSWSAGWGQAGSAIRQAFPVSGLPGECCHCGGMMGPLHDRAGRAARAFGMIGCFGNPPF